MWGLCHRLHTDVDVTKSSQALAELLNIGLVGLDLFAIGVLGGTFLFGVETQVLEQNNLAPGGVVDGLFSLGTNTVLGEDDVLSKKLPKFRNNGLQAVLGVGLAVGAAEVGHEHDGLGAIVDSILDGREGTDDTLVVGNVVALVEGDVEIDL